MRPRSAKLRRAQAPEEAKPGFLIKEVDPGDTDFDDRALQRPMKRLKRHSSPCRAELAAELENDLQDETIEDESEEDFGENARRLLLVVCSGSSETLTDEEVYALSGSPALLLLP